MIIINNNFYRIIKYFSITVCLLVCFIVLINSIGLLFNCYSVENLQRFARPNDTSISYEFALGDIRQLKYLQKSTTTDTSNQEKLFEQIVTIVFKRMSNLPDRKYIGTNLYKVSIFDNWILWLKYSVLDPDDIYEFADPYRALKRGVGFCSQQNIAVAEILREFGYKAGIMGLNGHVVAWAKSTRGIYILDADYGVILPFDLSYACSHKSELIDYYSKMQLKMLSKEKLMKEANRIANIYCANIGYNFKYKEGVDGTFINNYKSREDFLYILKWLLPFYIGYQSAIVYLITVNKY